MLFAHDALAGAASPGKACPGKRLPIAALRTDVRTALLADYATHGLQIEPVLEL
jgi:hypothetical protein